MPLGACAACAGGAVVAVPGRAHIGGRAAVARARRRGPPPRRGVRGTAVTHTTQGVAASKCDTKYSPLPLATYVVESLFHYFEVQRPLWNHVVESRSTPRDPNSPQGRTLLRIPASTTNTQPSHAPVLLSLFAGRVQRARAAVRAHQRQPGLGPYRHRQAPRCDVQAELR